MILFCRGDVDKFFKSLRNDTPAARGIFYAKGGKMDEKKLAGQSDTLIAEEVSVVRIIGAIWVTTHNHRYNPRENRFECCAGPFDQPCQKLAGFQIVKTLNGISML